jgi:hypothetical protein
MRLYQTQKSILNNIYRDDSGGIVYRVHTLPLPQSHNHTTIITKFTSPGSTNLNDAAHELDLHSSPSPNSTPDNLKIASLIRHVIIYVLPLYNNLIQLLGVFLYSEIVIMIVATTMIALATLSRENCKMMLIVSTMMQLWLKNSKNSELLMIPSYTSLKSNGI